MLVFADECCLEKYLASWLGMRALNNTRFFLGSVNASSNGNGY